MDEYPDDPRAKGSYFDVIFAVIVLLTAGFSTVTTYIGFSKDLPEYMAMAIAAIIGFGLLGVNFKLRQGRLNDDPIWGVLVVFMMIVVFSFISNTNAFYSFLIRDDIVRETQQEAWSVFDKESSRALQEIEQRPGYQAELRRIAEIENEITKLRDQITDPRNPGLGERARAHVEKIEELLETRLTERVAPDAERPMQEHEEYARAIEAHIRELIEERRSRGVVDLLQGTHAEIQRLRQRHEQRMATRDYQRKHTDEMYRDLKGIENTINRTLNLTPPLVLKEINDEADEVGKFKYTWRNIIAWINPVAIVLGALLGALLDVLAPTMSFALYRPRHD